MSWAFERMRILMVSDVYFPRVNGVSTSIQVFREALQAAGHAVTLIAPAYPQTPAETDATLIRIASRGVWLDPEDRMMRMQAIMQQADTLAAQGFDIVHIHTPFVAHYAGLKLAKRLRVPVVATYHTFFEEYLYNYIRWLPRASLRYVARHFSRAQCNDLDALIVPSTAMREVLTAYGVQTPLQVLPTGLDPALFQLGDGAQFRQQQRIPAQRPVLLYVGRVAFEKNIQFLLHVVQHLKTTVPDILLIIAGEGPAQASLRQQATAMGLDEQVLFLGYMPRDGRLQSCYKAADVFVFASRTETQGLVLIEAMASGTPVVSTAVMGTRDVMGSGQGGLVAEEQVADFRNKVQQLLEDKTLHAQKRQEAQQRVLDWSHAAQAQRLVQFYQAQCAA